jgi:hypothetical protein
MLLPLYSFRFSSYGVLKANRFIKCSTLLLLQLLLSWLLEHAVRGASEALHLLVVAAAAYTDMSTCAVLAVGPACAALQYNGVISSASVWRVSYKMLSCAVYASPCCDVLCAWFMSQHRAIKGQQS